MADENVKNAPLPEGEIKPTTTTSEKTGGDVFTKEQLEQIVKDRLGREQAKREEAERKAREQAEAAALAKNQEWQKLAEKSAHDLEALRNELKARDLRDKRRAIGAKFNLPPELADRLVGEDDQDIEADAKKMAELLPKAPKPQPGPNATNPGASGQTGETDAQKRQRIFRGQSIFDPEVSKRMGGGVFIKKDSE